MKRFKVLNVKCEGCARTLKEGLQDQFGEIEVDLELMPREIVVFNDNIDEVALREQLKKLGYPMADDDLGFVEDVGAKAKSFVSCAIGKSKNMLEDK